MSVEKVRPFAVTALFVQGAAARIEDGLCHTQLCRCTPAGCLPEKLQIFINKSLPIVFLHELCRIGGLAKMASQELRKAK
jgi:hypothetical protein